MAKKVAIKTKTNDPDVSIHPEGYQIDCLPFDPNTAKYERDLWGLGDRVVDEHSYVEYVPPIARPDVYDKNIGWSHESDIDPLGELNSDAGSRGERVIQKVDYKEDRLLEQSQPQKDVAASKPSARYQFNAKRDKGVGSRIIPPSTESPRRRSERSK